MVEFGHGSHPVAYRQPARFVGQRSYIGVEAWLGDPNHQAREALQELKTAHPGQNIRYIERPYGPTTALQDGIADEVFLSNVFGDPHIALLGKFGERAQYLLHEISRLTAKTGVIVIRETITPIDAWRVLSDEAIQNAGLQSAARHEQTESEVWKRLESRYDSETGYNLPEWRNFYQFLTKTVLSQAGN